MRNRQVCGLLKNCDQFSFNKNSTLKGQKDENDAKENIEIE